ncbi:MAG: ECF transporter S component [Lachnospiraceae bacterium]|nr:ECF transporter S component [Lachnospiraceae bacterium]
MNTKKSFGTREIVTTAVLLAICIVSQIFKNLSVFITGPIINTCIVLAVLTCGLPCALILCVITPVTAFFIAASPVMNLVPGIIPLIMLGNAVLAVTVHFLLKKDMIAGGRKAGGIKSYLKAVLCALAKGAFMGLTIALWLLPTFIPADHKLRNMMPKLQMTFSVIQFVTACIGFAYVFIIWAALRHDKL